MFVSNERACAGKYLAVLPISQQVRYKPPVEANVPLRWGEHVLKEAGLAQQFTAGYLTNWILWFFYDIRHVSTILQFFFLTYSYTSFSFELCCYRQ